MKNMLSMLGLVLFSGVCAMEGPAPQMTDDSRELLVQVHDEVISEAQKAHDAKIDFFTVFPYSTADDMLFATGSSRSGQICAWERIGVVGEDACYTPSLCSNRFTRSSVGCSLQVPTLLLLAKMQLAPGEIIDDIFCTQDKTVLVHFVSGGIIHLEKSSDGTYAILVDGGALGSAELVIPSLRPTHWEK